MGASFAIQACPDRAVGERHGYKVFWVQARSRYNADYVQKTYPGIVILLTALAQCRGTQVIPFCLVNCQDKHC
jgi:hypothetical protein